MPLTAKPAGTATPVGAMLSVGRGHELPPTIAAMLVSALVQGHIAASQEDRSESSIWAPIAPLFVNESWLDDYISGGGGGSNNTNNSVNNISSANDSGNGSVCNNDGLNDSANVGSGLSGELGGGDFYVFGSMANGSSANNSEIVVLAKMAVMSVVLGLMILITIIGNVFVIAAIILERNLQNVANYLVASLAVADLFVACLVMPLGAVYEISQGWILGPELCDIWTSCDVLCCTASILHLVAIASDRYWTVTNIDYQNLRTPARVFFMIFCVWFTALVVSLAPQFGWRDPEYMQRIEQQKCLVSQDVAYQIFATCCTFYVPLLVILVLYWKIYKIAQKRIQRRSRRPFPAVGNQNQVPQPQTLPPPHQQQRAISAERKRLRICFGKVDGSGGGGEGGYNAAARVFDGPKGNASSLMNMREETEFSVSNFDSKSHAGTEMTTASSDLDMEFRTPTVEEISTVSHQIAATTQQQHVLAISLAAKTAGVTLPCTPDASATPSASPLPAPQLRLLASIANPHHKLTKRRQLLEAKRERKAAQTLAIITGAFVVCWLPFFVMALLQSLCKSCHIPAAVSSIFLWLGYLNSTLNPIIYTIFNPEFRRAFRRILYGRKQLSHSRSGKI